MPLFRKKPVVIEAIQFKGDENLMTCLDFLKGQKAGGDDSIIIMTLEGNMREIKMTGLLKE